MFIRPLQYLLRLVLAIVFLSGSVSSFGYVWCLADDGHAALELGLAGDCDRTLPAPAPPADPAALAACADDCGPCLDVAAAPQWGATRSRDSAAPVALPAPLVAPAAVHLALPNTAVLPGPRVPDASLCRTGPLRQHRTVVLLI